jgi:hypothetical protein
MKKLIGLLVTLLIFSGKVSANEPYSFKSFKLGDVLDESLLSDTFSCSRSKVTGLDTRCSLQSNKTETIAGVEARISLGLADKKLKMINISFSERGFREVSEALIQKYGNPSSDKTETVQNGMGASFDNRVISWDNGASTITTSQRASKVDKSSVMFILNEVLDKFPEQKKLKAKKNAEDL